MSGSDLQAVKTKLISAGLEIYRTRESEIEIAERVRLHIMDSGIRVRGDFAVTFTARAQRSDFGGGVSSDQLFDRVRSTVGQGAVERGYTEETARTVDVTDPMDDAKILDTWYEVVYAIGTTDPDGAVEEVQWALRLDKSVTP